eukprot:2883872-Alexandrium_andersonii.AAC.1
MDSQIVARIASSGDDSGDSGAGRRARRLGGSGLGGECILLSGDSPRGVLFNDCVAERSAQRACCGRWCDLGRLPSGRPRDLQTARALLVAIHA